MLQSVIYLPVSLFFYFFISCSTPYRDRSSIDLMLYKGCMILSTIVKHGGQIWNNLPIATQEQELKLKDRLKLALADIS